MRLAARRFGFRRKANLHPADSVDDARLAAAGIVAALAQMDKFWDRETKDEMTVQAQSVFGGDLTEAKKLVVFGKWLSDQSGTKHEMVRRLSKRVMELAGVEALSDLEQMVAAVCDTGNGLSEDVQDGMETVRRLVR